VAGHASEIAALRARIPRGRRIDCVVADVAVDAAAVSSAVSGAEAVVSLLPQPLHRLVADACIAHKVNMVTASYASAFGDARQDVEQRARAAGVAVLCEMGLDPGIDHMAVMQMKHRLLVALDAHADVHGKPADKPPGITAMESLCGGLVTPECARNPIAYKLSWSPRGMLTALRNPARFLRDGAIVDVPGDELLAHAKPLRIRDLPALALEEYPNRDALAYRERYGFKPSDPLETFYRGTIRYAGFARSMRGIARTLVDAQRDDAVAGAPWRQLVDVAELGRDGTRFLEWAGALPDGRASPKAHSRLDALAELFADKLSMDEADRDLVVMVHCMSGRPAGRAGTQIDMYSTLVMAGSGGLDTAMAKTVGATAAVGALLVNRAPGGGVFLPTDAWVFNDALAMLEQEGIKLEHRMEMRPSSAV